MRLAKQDQTDSKKELCRRFLYYLNIVEVPSDVESDRHTDDESDENGRPNTSHACEESKIGKQGTNETTRTVWERETTRQGQTQKRLGTDIDEEMSELVNLSL